jgi:ribulose-phosphate 3-epimerase
MREDLKKNQERKPIISASILSANFAELGNEAKAVLDAGVDQIHFDVMDHHFVPNLSFGAVVCRALRHAGIQAPIDVHLMVEEPQTYIHSFAKAGANLIALHPETVKDVRSVLQNIRDEGMQAGLVFNPENHIDVSEEILKDLDLLILMTVKPGFDGQAFIEECVDKIRSTRKLLDSIGSKSLLGVDGGIKVENIRKVAEAGADFFVVGSGLFRAKNYAERMVELRKEILSVMPHRT